MTHPQPVPQTAPPPGWYPDEAQPGLVRWWSGQGWTDHVSAVSVAPSPAGDDERWTSANLVVPQGKTLGVRALVWGVF
ncbi:MAG: DUF2510 domain-containing protein, partial [Protaetiibacter sp.]